MSTAVKLLAAAGVCLGSSFTAQAGTILLATFDYGPTTYNEMETTLESNGHTVDQVDARTGGALASALGSAAYDQVFFYDLTSSRYINQTDIDAVASFYSTHNSIVQDSRSYGLNNTTPDLKSVEWQLINNVANAFDRYGGGLWIGTDHNPTWTQNANPILSALGFDPIEGSHSQAVNDWDPTSELLDGLDPTQLWAQGHSVGHVSLGIQPNGVDMRYHFGHSSPASGAIPYISANFGTYIAPDEDPDDHLDTPVVPLPAGFPLILSGLAALGIIGRKRRKA
ncbi:VPLPA-CTERM sorting domain-containing protein [Celeribacter arenosi]|uniref:VPLPA-CTERM protein sorting domain-containing protein n=1 Tax=Celeribacter arenosi TaxID=792649 RepID=A0ABP7KCH9_9RHOB